MHNKVSSLLRTVHTMMLRLLNKSFYIKYFFFMVKFFFSFPFCQFGKMGRNFPILPFWRNGNEKNLQKILYPSTKIQYSYYSTTCRQLATQQYCSLSYSTVGPVQLTSQLETVPVRQRLLQSTSYRQLQLLQYSLSTSNFDQTSSRPQSTTQLLASSSQQLAVVDYNQYSYRSYRYCASQKLPQTLRQSTVSSLHGSTVVYYYSYYQLAVLATVLARNFCPC